MNNKNKNRFNNDKLELNEITFANNRRSHE